MKIEEIDFIARRYKEGKFVSEQGWRRLGIARRSSLVRYRAAAAIGVLVVLSAAAAFVFKEYKINGAGEKPEPTENVCRLREVKVIDFECAHLSEVIEEIESVYGVNVENIPTSPENYELSLHYEGTASELIAIINDILGTEMTVTEK